MLLILILATLTTNTIFASSDCVFFKPSQQDYYLFNATIVEQSNAALMGATVKLLNVTTREVEFHESNMDLSKFKVKLVKGNKYSILISKPGYYAKRIDATVGTDGCMLCFESLGSVQPGRVDNPNTKQKLGTLKAHISLRKIELKQPVKIENLYFNVNEYELTANAQKELDKFYQVLRDNPGINVEIAVHTDQRGKATENNEISQRRAKAITNYLEKKGIRSDRMIARGYGETKLIKNCPPGEICNEELHQTNRRVEFIVTENTFVDKGGDEEILGFVQTTPDTVKPDYSDYQFGAFGEDLKTDKIVEDLSETIATKEKQLPKNKNFISKSAEYYKVETTNKPKMSTDYVDALVKDNLTTSTKVKIDKDNNADKEAEFITEETKQGFTNKRVRILPQTYTGYKVEVKYTKGELKEDNPLFNKFGGIFCDEVEPGYYSYLLGNFSNKASAQSFIDTVLIHKAQDAEVVRYKKGKRMKK